MAPETSALCPSMCEAVWVTVGAGPGWVAASWGVPAAVGVTAGPGLPPGAESRLSWSMFQPVHVVGALAQGGLCPTAVCTTCGPRTQRDALGVGPAGHELGLAAVERV